MELYMNMHVSVMLWHIYHAITIIRVSDEIIPINDQIMISVKLPELAIYDVKVFIREETSELVDIILII